MKNCLIGISFFWSLCLQGQESKVTVDTIKTKELKAIRSIHDLLPSLPGECTVKRFDITIRDQRTILMENQPGDTTEVKGIESKEGGLTATTGGNYNHWRGFVWKAKAGTRIIIDVKNFNCPKALQRSYNLIVAE